MKKILKAALMVLCLGLIFGLFIQDGREYSSTLRIIIHFIAYLVLGAVVLNFIYEFNSKYIAYISFGICSIFSIIVESYQASMLKIEINMNDCFIDIIASFLGICLFFLIRKSYLNHKLLKEKR